MGGAACYRVGDGAAPPSSSTGARRRPARIATSMYSIAITTGEPKPCSMTLFSCEALCSEAVVSSNLEHAVTVQLGEPTAVHHLAQAHCMLLARSLRGAVTSHVLVALPLVQHQVQCRHQSEGEARARACEFPVATAAVAGWLCLRRSVIL